MQNLLWILVFNFSSGVTSLPATMPLEQCIEEMRALNSQVYRTPVCINSVEPARQYTLQGPNSVQAKIQAMRGKQPGEVGYYTETEQTWLRKNGF